MWKTVWEGFTHADLEALLLSQSQNGRVASDSASTAADAAGGDRGGLRVAGLEGAGVARGDAGVLGSRNGDGSLFDRRC